MIIISWLIIGGVCAAIGYCIGEMGGKNNQVPGCFLGFLLGPIGLIIVALLPPSEAAAPTAPDEDKARKIADLEAQLAKVKGTAPETKSAFGPVNDDGEVSTYRLD